MTLKSLFKLAIFSMILFSVLGAVVADVYITTLPTVLQEYLLQTSEVETSDSVGIYIVFTVLLLISVIGIWTYKNWARYLYLILIFGSFFLLNEPTVMNPIESILDYLSSLAEGILIALMFFTPLSNDFKAKTKIVDENASSDDIIK